ncbi:MAG: cell division protein FtsH [Candidatus Blackburnbacteria bacterium RIFCSPHIGHO2_01_FULL_43_15b]|uniref:ATP-dependent zinc metalloprotease FtsH n=1 Tax=Candidatus Blackburnbacteria bacterium RIFCSPHIGHO2_01_FULL_43_15b TaxID=1797513 RepID=A0A1G1V0A9_9BACT|nr:MAG: cell division protein FtsH [Candidatus Blackburnbacteria bacterium RIFCSPHIGHO2_01_FULL_43_15b]
MNLRNILLFLLILFFVGPLFLSFLGERVGETVPLPAVISQIKQGQVENIRVAGDRLQVKYKNGDQKMAVKEGNVSFTEILKDSGVDPSTVPFSIDEQRLSRFWMDALGVLLPVGVMAIFFLFIFRQARGAQDNLFSFGKSGARAFAKGKQSVTFRDVAGVDEAKKELEEVVDFLKNPGKYRTIGARTPKGVLLFGPSGVGKTLLARGVAGEAGVPFFSMAGSEFMEMLVGVGASRVRDLFLTAKKAAPSIIFIDEIDAIGRQRGYGLAGGHDEREQTLNQILVEMDGFTPNDSVLVIAATNRGDLLDPALLRPGRFDRRVTLDLPDREGREAILKIHARGKKFAEEIDWERVASRTVGFSGADLENMLNEAAIAAARDNRKEIDMSDITEAATKVKLGPARRRLQSEDDKKITAYHEAGHAVASHVMAHLDPIDRISIVARNESLGQTSITPDVDRVHETRTRILEMLCMILGGRAAEELVFSEMTIGASNDIAKATELARRMVVEFGMSDLGPINWQPYYDIDMIGRLRSMESQPIGQKMQDKVDEEIKKIVSNAFKEAQAIVKKERKTLDVVVSALNEKETLDRDEFEKLVGQKIVKKANGLARRIAS